TPSLLALLMTAGASTRPQLALRHVICGGEALSSGLAAGFFEGHWPSGCKLSNIYGPTECCVDVTLQTLGRAPASRASVPIGRPLGNLRTLVLDGSGQRAPIGVGGEIWLSGPCLGRGYLGLPELTAQKFTGVGALAGVRAYRTGDFGAWTEN